MAASKNKIKPQSGTLSHSEDDGAATNNYLDDDIPPSDYYCTVCKAPMNSLLTWQTHTSGKKHQKKVASSSFGLERKTRIPPGANIQQIKVSGIGPSLFPTKPSNEVAQVQAMFDRINDEPVVGLKFITEIWRMDENLEPVYRCTLCSADCQAITITNHVIGFRHRMRFIKLMNGKIYERLLALNMKKSHLSEEVAYYSRKLQHHYGKGFVQVENEVSEKDSKVNIKRERDSDESDEESASLFPPIKLKVKSVDPKQLSKCFFSLEEAKKAAILVNMEKSNLSKNKYTEATYKQQLEQIENIFICQKLSSLNKDDMMRITKQFMKGDFSFVHTLLDLQEVQNNANKIIKNMGARNAEEN